MIKKALHHFIAPAGVAKTESFEIGVCRSDRTSSFFSRIMPIKLRAFLFLETDEIAFTQYTAALKTIAGSSLPAKNIRCLWYVVSAKGGIYLHEALDREASERGDGMRHRFIVIRSDGLTVSLGPGDSRNLRLGERLGNLVSEARRMGEDVFLRETAKVFEACSESSR